MGSEHEIGPNDVEADEKLAQHIERFLYEVHDEDPNISGPTVLHQGDELHYFGSPESNTTQGSLVDHVLDDHGPVLLTAELLQAQLDLTPTRAYESPSSHLLWDECSDAIDIECFSALSAQFLEKDVVDLPCHASTSGPYSTPKSPNKPETTSSPASPHMEIRLHQDIIPKDSLKTRKSRRAAETVLSASKARSGSQSPTQSRSPRSKAIEKPRSSRGRNAQHLSPKAGTTQKRASRGVLKISARASRQPETVQGTLSWPTTLINYDDDDESEIDIVG